MNNNSTPLDAAAPTQPVSAVLGTTRLPFGTDQGWRVRGGAFVPMPTADIRPTVGAKGLVSIKGHVSAYASATRHHSAIASKSAFVATTSAAKRGAPPRGIPT